MFSRQALLRSARSAAPQRALLGQTRTFAAPASSEKVKPPVALFGVDGTYATALVRPPLPAPIAQLDLSFEHPMDGRIRASRTRTLSPCCAAAANRQTRHLKQTRTNLRHFALSRCIVHGRRQDLLPRAHRQGPRRPRQPAAEGSEAGHHPQGPDPVCRRQERHRRRAAEAHRCLGRDHQELPRHPRREQPPWSSPRCLRQVQRAYERRPR